MDAAIRYILSFIFWTVIFKFFFDICVELKNKLKRKKSKNTVTTRCLATLKADKLDHDGFIIARKGDALELFVTEEADNAVFTLITANQGVHFFSFEELSEVRAC
jgi:hypothetical protein